MVVEFSWLIPGLPLISFVIPLIFGNRLRHGGGYIALGSIGASLALAALVFLEVSLGTNFSTGQPLKLPFEVSATWFSFENTILEGGILVDQLTAIMVLTITLVSTLIIIFSLGYMSREKGLPRYYAIMSLFISSMLGIVTANNFLQLYVFWELVGLCSYLLIGFWYTRPAAAAAAKKAFLVTRLGDVMLLGGILIIFNLYHTFNFLAIQEQLQLFDPSVMLG
ncbi:MAG: proton-conducting transporter membrane subunit, partial [Candidatus Bathyarchaeia archaeon]